jgi:hypothetical protein
MRKNYDGENDYIYYGERLMYAAVVISIIIFIWWTVAL